MTKISLPRRLSRLLGLAALFSIGLFAAGVTPAQADPPCHAKAKGWHKKQAKKHKHVNACHDERDDHSYSRNRRDDRRYDSRYDDRDDRRYDSRYEDDYRRRQDQDRRRREEERRRWEAEQRRRQDDRYYGDRYDDRSSRSGGSLEDLAGVFLGGGGDLGGLLGGNRGGGLGDLLGGGNRGGSLGGLLGGLKIRK